MWAVTDPGNAVCGEFPGDAGGNERLSDDQHSDDVTRDVMGSAPTDPAPSAAPADSAPDRPSEAPLLGQVIAERYRVTGTLGKGGMGLVYRAEHVLMHKSVAIKVLHRELGWLPEVVARFEREAIAAGRLDHPHVATAMDFGRLEDGSFYLVLEFVQGTSVADLLDGGVVPEARAARIASQICDALAAAHQAGIVHRDLKPENIMLVDRPGEGDFVKVLDFGIAKVAMDDTAEEDRTGHLLTRRGTVFGTPQYMAPEQAAGELVDHRCDLYTVGLILYEMLVGYAPFRDDDVGKVLTMQIKTPAPPLPDFVDPELSAITMKLLEKDPADRIQTAAEVRGLLEDVLHRIAPREMFSSVSIVSDVRRSSADTARPGVLDAPGVEPGAPGRRSSRGRGVAIAVVVVGIAAAGAWTLRSRLRPVADDAPSASATAARPGLSAPDPVIAPLIARASTGDKDAVDELERRRPADRSVAEWIALARGRMELGRTKPALEAYGKALDLDPSLAKDLTLLHHVRRAADDDATAEEALRVAALRLGSAGADILYDVWVATKAKTTTTQLAKQLVYSADVRSKASPALDVLLDLRATESCEDFKKLLPRATLNGDTRALRILQPMMFKNGCGANKSEDCYPCLRGDDALADAVAAVKKRREPTY